MTRAGVRITPFARFVLQSLLAVCVSTAPALAQDIYLRPLSETAASLFPAVGRIGAPGFETQGCTATLIAPDLIVTAAHCVSADGQSNNIFAAGWRNGGAPTTRRILREIRHPDYAPGGNHKPNHDVALALLNAPVRNIAPLVLAQDEGGELNETVVALVGYHIKNPDALSGDLTCDARDMSDGLVHLACPVIQGNSGAPVLRKQGPGDWQVVGVISSRIGKGAIAVHASDWLQQQLSAHLSQ